MTLPDLTNYYATRDIRPARGRFIRASDVQTLITDAHWLYAAVCRNRQLCVKTQALEETDQASADAIDLLPVSGANQGVLRFTAPAVLSQERTDLEVRVEHAAGTVTVVICDRAGLVLGGVAQHTATTLETTTLTIAGVVAATGTREVQVRVYMAATAPGTPHELRQVAVRELPMTQAQVIASPHFQQLQLEAAGVGKPYSAWLLSTIIDELHASNTRRVPVWGQVYDVGRAPLLASDRAGRGHVMFVDLSPECRALRLAYTLEVMYANVSFAVYAIDERGVWYEISPHVSRPMGADPATYTVDCDLTTVRRRGGTIVGIALEPLSYTSGKTSTYSIEVGGYNNRFVQTTSTGINGTWTPLAACRVSWRDAGVAVEGLPSHQSVRVTDSQIWFYPPVDGQEVGAAGATQVHLEELGQAKLLGVCIEEVYGTPYRQGGGYPIPDPDALKIAMGPGQPPIAVIHELPYKAADYLFTDRVPVQATGGRPAPAGFDLDNPATSRRSSRSWDGQRLDFYQDIPGDSGRVLVWEGPIWVDDEAPYTFAGDNAVPGGNRWRVGLDVLPVLLAISDAEIDLDLIVEFTGGGIVLEEVYERVVRARPVPGWSEDMLRKWFEDEDTAGERGREHNLMDLWPRREWNTLGLQQVRLRLRNEPPGATGVRLWVRTSDLAPANNSLKFLDDPVHIICPSCTAKPRRSSAWASIGVEIPE